MKINLNPLKVPWDFEGFVFGHMAHCGTFVPDQVLNRAHSSDGTEAKINLYTYYGCMSYSICAVPTGE